MRISAISHINQTERNDQGLSLTQRTCDISSAAQSAVLLPILIAVMVPFAMLAADALAQPETLDRMTDAPVNAITAVTGVLVWALMFGIPTWHALKRFGSKRSIEIANGQVSVTDANLMGSKQWNAPLCEFEGLSHHQRTSLSGTRNELILMHKKSDRCLLLKMADNISQNETEDLANRLDLALLPPGAMFRQNNTLRLPTFKMPIGLRPQNA